MTRISDLAATGRGRDAIAGTELLTTSEAASRVRLSPRTLERLRVSGEGPRYLKAGPGKRARVLYRQQDLEYWLLRYSYHSTSEYPVSGEGTGD